MERTAEPLGPAAADRSGVVGVATYRLASRALVVGRLARYLGLAEGYPEPPED